MPKYMQSPRLHHSASDRKREEEKGVVGKEINRIRTYFLTDCGYEEIGFSTSRKQSGSNKSLL